MNLLSTSSLIDSVEVSKWEVPQTEDPLELVQYSIAKFEGLKVINGLWDGRLCSDRHVFPIQCLDASGLDRHRFLLS